MEGSMTQILGLLMVLLGFSNVHGQSSFYQGKTITVVTGANASGENAGEQFNYTLTLDGRCRE
jgi:hypothetical protein